MKDVKRLPWHNHKSADFEKICAIFLSKKYNMNFQATSIVNDGGIDVIAVGSESERLTDYWVECKHWKRDIDLDAIGKNVILAYIKDSKYVIFFSTSRIRPNTKRYLNEFFETKGLKPDFYDGQKLDYEIIKFPSILRKYFKNFSLTTNNDNQYGFFYEAIISEFRDHSELRTINAKSDSIFKLKRGNTFFLNILFSVDNKIVRKVDYVVGNNDEFNIYPKNESIHINKESSSYSLIIEFTCFSSENEIKLPPIFLELIDEKSNKEKCIIEIGKIDQSGVKEPAYFGNLTSYLSDKINKIAQLSSDGYFQLLNIKGIGGVGKSRFADEVIDICKKQHFIINEYNISRTNDTTLLNEMLTNFSKLPPKLRTLEIKKEDIKSFYETSGIKDEIVLDICTSLAIYSSTPDHIDVYQAYQIVIKIMFHFLNQESQHRSRLIVIDNIQETNPNILKLINELVNLLVGANIRLFLILIENTETILPRNKASVSTFNRQLKFIENDYPNTVHNLIIDKFSIDEANLFLKSFIAENTQYKDELKLIVEKVGTKPYDLYSAIILLEQLGILELKRRNEWEIVDYRDLTLTLNDKKNVFRNTVKSRIEYFNYIDGMKIKLDALLKFMKIFNYHIPFEFVKNYLNITSQELIQFEKSCIIKINDMGYIQLYHDNISLYLNENKDSYYLPTSNDFLMIHKWISHTKLTVDKLTEYALRTQISIQLNTIDENILLFRDALLFAESALNSQVFLQLSRKIMFALNSTHYYLKDIEQYTEIAAIIINYIPEYANIDGELNFFEEVYIILNRFKLKIDGLKYSNFIHRYANALLHANNKQESLKVLKKFLRFKNIVPHYSFITHDRLGVLLTEMDQKEEALEHLRKAEEIAHLTEDREMNLSIINSDLGYYYFKNNLSLEKTIQYFSAATTLDLDVNDHIQTRPLEIAHQKALISILNKDYLKAENSLDEAYELSKEVNNILLLKRAIILYLSYFHLVNDFSEYDRYANEYIELSNAYDDRTSLWKIYMLEAIRCTKINKLTQAYNYYDKCYKIIKDHTLNLRKRIVIANIQTFEKLYLDKLDSKDKILSLADWSNRIKIDEVTYLNDTQYALLHS
jgi:transcription termination factor NusB